ncbi:MAG: cytochrome C [Flavobacteriaceae bacterium]|nr:cytochrome C [Flavobacteriaceae bacterium]
MSLKNKFKALYNLPNYIMVFALLCGGLLLNSCNKQARGFALPKGDIEKGNETYKRLSCNECHEISDIEWIGGSDSIKIYLGGEVSGIKSYGDLVTSIINPSHKISQSYKKKFTNEEGLSKMKNYNQAMTVEELINLVTFLQSEYQVRTPPTYSYPYHP